MRWVVLIAGFFVLIGNARAQQLRASDGQNGDSFGRSVSVSGNNGLVGASSVNGFRGAAYYYHLNTTTGSEDKKLTAPGAQANDSFGLSTSLNGNSALIGAIGRNGGRGVTYYYADVTTAAAPVELSIAGGAALDGFGVAVSLSGVHGLIGAYGVNNFTGAAYYFANVATPTTPLLLTDPNGVSGETFGSAVSLSGNIGLVGTSRGGSYAGVALLYNFGGPNPSSATEIFEYNPSGPGHVIGDAFGNSVSLYGGNSALIGAFQKDGARGAAYYIADLTNPGTQVELKAFDQATSPGREFGQSVSLSGTTGLVGAYAKDANNVPGAAYLFPNVNTPSEQVKLFASNPAAPQDLFGFSVSLDGDRFLIGAYLAGAGAAYAGTVSSVTTLDNGTSKSVDGISFISKTDWIIGKTSSGNQVTLKAGNTADVSATSKAIYIGQNTGSNNNKLIVEGSVTATTVNVGASSGSTGNTLQINDTGKVSGGTIAVNNGGTLLLSGTIGNDRIGNSTAVTIANGGTLATSGRSEGSSAAGATPGLGALTLQGGSTIDFATGQNGSTLLATSGATSGTGVISILNWSGTATADNGAAGNDRLLFASDPTSSMSLGQFQFYDDNNVAFAPGAMVINYNNFFELVPIPEPATWFAGGIAAIVLGLSSARRRSRPIGQADQS